MSYQLYRARINNNFNLAPDIELPNHASIMASAAWLYDEGHVVEDELFGLGWNMNLPTLEGFRLYKIQSGRIKEFGKTDVCSRELIVEEARIS